MLILEDDVEFCDDFLSKMESLIDSLPEDWDAVTLNGTDHPQEKPKHYNLHLNQCKYATGAFAILFNKKVIPTLISLLEEEEKLVDIYYAESMRKLNWFKAKEKLVLHLAGFSEIKSKFVDYKHLR